ncbi:hypothetical protein FKP32DRAFT_1297494 [Trametes sanguinea]|nr:hypothetical protein FKP32DRAFT_1297494 [Trametes sanguinea]
MLPAYWLFLVRIFSHPVGCPVDFRMFSVAEYDACQSPSDVERSPCAARTQHLGNGSDSEDLTNNPRLTECVRMRVFAHALKFSRNLQRHMDLSLSKPALTHSGRSSCVPEISRKQMHLISRMERSVCSRSGSHRSCQHRVACFFGVMKASYHMLRADLWTLDEKGFITVPLCCSVSTGVHREAARCVYR